MLKKKLRKGQVVGLSVEAVQGGVTLTLDEVPADSSKERKQQTVLLNPADVSAVIDGLRKPYFHTKFGDKTLEFKVPQSWEHQPIYIAIKPVSVDEDVLIFPLHEHEVRFIRKALESMAASLLFVGTWSGKLEEW